MKKIIYILMILGIVGCAAGQKLPSVCDTAPADSMLCSASNQMGIRIEDVGNMAIVVNTIMIAEGQYTALDAKTCLTVLKTILQDETLSYSAFVSFATDYLGPYGGLIVLFEPYFSHFANTDMLITKFDRDMLTMWIDQRLAGL